LYIMMFDILYDMLLMCFVTISIHADSMLYLNRLEFSDKWRHAGLDVASAIKAKHINLFGTQL